MLSWERNSSRFHAKFKLLYSGAVSGPTGRRLRLKCDGTRAETRFRLSAKRTSPFKSTGTSVQSTAGSRGVRISGSNAGYTVFRGSVKSTGYPPHSPVSPSLPLPCVTVCHHISTGRYVGGLLVPDIADGTSGNTHLATQRHIAEGPKPEAPSSLEDRQTAASNLSKDSLWEIRRRTEIELPVQLRKAAQFLPCLPNCFCHPVTSVLEYTQTTHVLHLHDRNIYTGVYMNSLYKFSGVVRGSKGRQFGTGNMCYERYASYRYRRPYSG
jgi:hypothetical protein